MWFRWDDFDQGFRLRDDFRRRIERVFDEYDTERNTARTWPVVSLADKGTALELRADLPGLSEKDVQITVNSETLTLTGERKVEVTEGYRLHRQERVPYRFARSYTLPSKIDPEKVAARMKDGVLTVTLEKAAESRPRAITVAAN